MHGYDIMHGYNYEITMSKYKNVNIDIDIFTFYELWVIRNPYEK
jgi:hypothetical protein